MSQENVEIVRRGFDAFTRGDMKALLDLFDPDVDIAQPPDLPGVPPRQHGHDGVLEALAIWPEQWDDYHIEILRVVADPGDQVLVTTQQGGRGKQSGVEVEMQFTFVFTLRRRRIIDWKIFMDEHQALKAAGLSE
jgi:ketosteroid isomerase-like protein